MVVAARCGTYLFRCAVRSQKLHNTQSAQAGAASRYPSAQGGEPQSAEAGDLAGVLRTTFGGGRYPETC